MPCLDGRVGKGSTAKASSTIDLGMVCISTTLDRNAS
jgi:hypothetical protein